MKTRVEGQKVTLEAKSHPQALVIPPVCLPEQPNPTVGVEVEVQGKQTAAPEEEVAAAG